MIYRRTTRILAALAIAVVGILVSSTASTSTTTANAATAPPIESVSLQWAVSNNVNTAGSLTPSRAAIAPATQDASGWSFTQGTGIVNGDTGALHLEFDGGLEVGNENRGNYGIQFTNLAIEMAPNGVGTLNASVATRGPGSTVWGTPADNVTVARFIVGAPTINGSTVSWTANPTADAVATNPAFPGAKQFPQSLINVLPNAFWGHFMQTDAAGASAQSNIDKLPAPITFSYSTGASSTTTTTTPSTSAPVTTPGSTLPATNAPVEASAGNLQWGIKSSFLGYLESPAAGGVVTAGDGASRDAAGIFTFPLTSGSQYRSSSDFSAPFGGHVHITAHGNVLDINIDDPRVQLNGTTGTLTVDATSKNETTGIVETYDDLNIATLDASGIHATANGKNVTIAKIPAKLTAAGAPVFGGFYSAGEALDPVTINLTVDTTENLPGATTPTVTCVEATVTAGGTVRLCGEGFMPGEQVQAFVHSEPIQIGITTADAAGKVADTFTVPATLSPGVHRFELRGVTSGLSLMSAEVTVFGGELPRTGSEPRVLIGLGLIALAAGVVLTASTTRRREAREA